MTTRPALTLLLLAAPLLAAGPALADPPGDTRLREALRSATLQLRTLEDEKAQWQARESELKAELEQQRRRAPGPAAASPRVERQVADLQRRLTQQQEASARAGEALARCESATREGSETGRAAEVERARLSALVVRLGARVEAAEAGRSRTYQVAKGLLDWIDGIGWAQALAAREPVLRLKRVELENAAQGWRDRLLESRSEPAAKP
jgi:chromosome segregation ATPase